MNDAMPVNPRRTPVGKRLRFEIFSRDNHTCRYCGATAPDVKITVDHVVPVTLGGTTDPSNLVTACVDCNAGKSSRQPDAATVEQVDLDALRWVQAQERAMEIRSIRRARQERATAAFEAAWGDDIDWIDWSWEQSLRQFLGTGIELEEILDAVAITRSRSIHRRNLWKYFCGVVWNKIRAFHDDTIAAMEYLSSRGVLDTTNPLEQAR